MRKAILNCDDDLVRKVAAMLPTVPDVEVVEVRIKLDGEGLSSSLECKEGGQIRSITLKGLEWEARQHEEPDGREA